MTFFRIEKKDEYIKRKGVGIWSFLTDIELIGQCSVEEFWVNRSQNELIEGVVVVVVRSGGGGGGGVALQLPTQARTRARRVSVSLSVGLCHLAAIDG